MLSLTKKEASISDEACEDENSNFVGAIALTNYPTTCPGVKSRKLWDYLAQREPQSQHNFLSETRVIGHGFLTSSAKEYCKVAKR